MHNQLKAKLIDYEETINNTQRCPECGQKASVEHFMRKRHKLRKQLKEVIQQRKVLKPIVEQLRDKIFEAEQSWRQVAKALIDLKQLEDNISRLEKETNPHKKAVQDYKDRLAKLRSQKDTYIENILSLESEIESYKFWATAFKEIRLELINNTLTELEMATTQHAEALGLQDWRIEFQTERETKSGNVQVGFKAKLFPPALEEPAKWENYSGGESQRWR